jgi:outer membrane lipoprotein-sorting protein
MMMKRTLFPVLVIILFLPGIGCEHENEISIQLSDDIGAIEEMSADRAEAFRNGDANGIAEHFTDDGI